MPNVQVATLGRILAGEEAGRFVEVIDDSASSGGYPIFTYADADKSPEVFDSWVGTFEDVERYFAESGWTIEWLPFGPSN